ncbi:hypothetical protein [Candidatus Hodgkinia cicadicola]|uniref:hypothetical protein n=1 Tax=Candidatus Hodgkinia cicadicola TaxID=573658 RepID=UPI0024151BFC
MIGCCFEVVKSMTLVIKDQLNDMFMFYLNKPNVMACCCQWWSQFRVWMGW